MTSGTTVHRLGGCEGRGAGLARPRPIKPLICHAAIGAIGEFVLVVSAPSGEVGCLKKASRINYGAVSG